MTSEEFGHRFETAKEDDSISINIRIFFYGKSLFTNDGIPAQRFLLYAGSGSGVRACTHTQRDNRRGEEFECLKCGYSEQADYVGPLNILHRFLTGQYGAGFKT